MREDILLEIEEMPRHVGGSVKGVFGLSICEGESKESRGRG